MKTIGILGGMSYQSSVLYYQLLNRYVQDRMGGGHSCKCILHSFDFEEAEKVMQLQDVDAAVDFLLPATQNLKLAGADAVIVACGSMNNVVEGLARAASIPVLHIADYTGEAIAQAGHRKVGLLGSRYTMEQDFFKSRLSQRFSLEVITPELEDRQVVHDIINTELARGVFSDQSRHVYECVVDRLIEKGAECVVLGCTEQPMLLSGVGKVPYINATKLHAEGAAKWALGEAYE